MQKMLPKKNKIIEINDIEVELTLKKKIKKKEPEQTEQQESEDEDRIDKISYVKLFEHIVNTHPRDFKDGEIFTLNLNEDIGNYSKCPCFKSDLQISKLA
jgi:hypothetical protein